MSASGLIETPVCARSMFWKRNQPPVVPKFGAIAQPLYPVIFEAYGQINATPNLAHRFVIRKLSGSFQTGLPPGRLVLNRILEEERRFEDRKHWERFFSQPTHSIQFSYGIIGRPSEPTREIVHAYLNFGLPGWDSKTIAVECGNFLVFSTQEMQTPSPLTQRNVGSASVWIILLFARYRSILVKAGIATERKPPDHVIGYRLTGDF